MFMLIMTEQNKRVYGGVYVLKRVLSVIFVNVSNALRSARFWGMVVLYVLLLIYSVRYTFYIGQPVSFTLTDALMVDTESFLLLICAVPSASLFADEWCSGRFLFSYLRTKKLGYAVSTMLSTFIISALVSIIALSLFIIGLSFINPLVGDIESESYFIRTMMTTNGELLIKGHIFPYYLLTVLTFSCFMGTMSTFAALVSVWLTNPYIAMVSPVVLIELFQILLGLFHLPVLGDPRIAFSMLNHPYQLLVHESGMGLSVISTLYPFIYTLICLVIIIFLAFVLIKRKYAVNSNLR